MLEMESYKESAKQGKIYYGDPLKFISVFWTVGRG